MSEFSTSAAHASLDLQALREAGLTATYVVLHASACRLYAQEREQPVTYTVKETPGVTDTLPDSINPPTRTMHFCASHARVVDGGIELSTIR